MKKLAKKLLCLTAVLALTLSLFTGCKSKNEKTLFEYAGQEVTFQEAHVYARIMQYQAEAQYGAYFGDSMWSMQVGTDSNAPDTLSAQFSAPTPILAASTKGVTDARWINGVQMITSQLGFSLANVSFSSFARAIPS